MNINFEIIDAMAINLRFSPLFMKSIRSNHEQIISLFHYEFWKPYHQLQVNINNGTDCSFRFSTPSLFSQQKPSVNQTCHFFIFSALRLEDKTKIPPLVRCQNAEQTSGLSSEMCQVLFTFFISGRLCVIYSGYFYLATGSIILFG